MTKLTLGFNEQDFEQYEAYRILKTKGRKISKYVAQLVLQEQQNSDIKSLIRETIQEELKNLDVSQIASTPSEDIQEKPSNSSKSKSKSKSEKDTSVDKFSGSDEDIVDSLLSSFPGMGD